MADNKKVTPATETPETEPAKKVRKPKSETAPTAPEAVASKPAATPTPAANKPAATATATPTKPGDKEAPAKKKVAAPAVKLTSRLQVKYFQEIRPALFKSLNLKSIMQVPKVEKIVVNVGVGDATSNTKLLEESVKELTDITGQKPVITKSKKSIATFKLRQDQAIGTKVTLRGVKMYQFLDKLVSIALPRVRDFRGVSRNSFDGRGNYTLGIKEQLIFPEINFDRVNKIRGMDIVIVTTAANDEQAYALLQALGMPFNR